MILDNLGKHKKRAKPAPSFVPHQAVVLSVDTAQRSGWAIHVCGKLVDWGEVDMLRPERSADRDGLCGWDAALVCGHALAVASGFGASETPLVLVFERPFRGTTQGAWIGAWRAAFKNAGGRERAMIGCYPATWRARVLGSGSMKREAARKAEQRRAEREAGQPVGPDAAAAICLGVWASRAGEVAAVLPKPRKPRAPKTTTPTLGCLSTPKPRKRKASAENTNAESEGKVAV